MIPVCRVSGLLAVALAGTGSWPHGAVDVMRPNAKPNLRALFDWHAADGHLDERGLTRLLRVQSVSDGFRHDLPKLFSRVVGKSILQYEHKRNAAVGRLPSSLPALLLPESEKVARPDDCVELSACSEADFARRCSPLSLSAQDGEQISGRIWPHRDGMV